MSNGASRANGIVTRWPLQAIAEVVAATAGRKALWLRDSCMKRPQGTESILNERRRNRAKVSAIEAPAVKVRDDPEASCLDNVFAIGPWCERSATMVFGMRGTVGDEFSVVSNPITCDLHAVAS